MVLSRHGALLVCLHNIHSLMKWKYSNPVLYPCQKNSITGWVWTNVLIPNVTYLCVPDLVEIYLSMSGRVVCVCVYRRPVCLSPPPPVLILLCCLSRPAVRGVRHQDLTATPPAATLFPTLPQASPALPAPSPPRWPLTLTRTSSGTSRTGPQSTSRSR